MKKESKFLMVVKNGGLFIVLIGVTFYLLFRKSNLRELIHTLTLVKPAYILIGIIVMGVFISCEAWNIKRSLILLGYQAGFVQCLKYAFVGSFFSSITPSATGGQPMQLYYMHKDKIEFSHSALALLVQLASYQLVTIIFALVGLMMQYHFLYDAIGRIFYLFFLGLIVNLGILLFTLTTIVSKKLSIRIIHALTDVLRKFQYAKADEFQKKADQQLNEYQTGTVYFRKNKGVLVRIFLTNCVQVFALQSIPYWVYRSFSFSRYSIWTVVGIQAVLYITVAALPVPGAVGISESGFLILFKLLFPASVLSGAMLLSRGISFYLFVLISGISVAVFTTRRRKKGREDCQRDKE